MAFRRRRYLRGRQPRRWARRKGVVSRPRKWRVTRSLYTAGRPTIGMPATQKVAMRYHTNFLLSPSNGGLATHYSFRANSIFDPDLSGIGHQPLGHDQWAQFYSSYCVLGSKIRVRAAKDNQTGANIQSNYLFGIILTNIPTLPTTDVNTLFEQGLATPVMIGVGNMTSTNVVSVNKKYSTRRFFNLRDVKDAQERVGAFFGANPPTNGDAYFHVFAAVTVAGGNDTNSIDCDVTLDYIVQLSDPVTLNGS